MNSLLNFKSACITALGLSLFGCNSESGSSAPLPTVDTMACGGGICTLDSGVVVNDAEATVIEVHLARGNVILRTQNSEVLTLSSPIHWTSNRSLTLQANNDIELFGGLTASQGKLILDNPGHDYEVRRPVNLSAGPTLKVNDLDFTVITSLGSNGSETGTDLQGIRLNTTKNYALGGDIDASETQDWTSIEDDIIGFVPIYGDEPETFVGILDGLGHVITGLYSSSGENYDFPAGLFDTIEDATIRNLIFIDSEIRNAENSSGTIAGKAIGENTITNVCILNSYILGPESSGGMIGVNAGQTTILDSCVLTSDIKGGDAEGGMIGDIPQNSGGKVTIERSYIYNTASSDDAYTAASLDDVDITDSFRMQSHSTKHPGVSELTFNNYTQATPYAEAGWDISTDPKGNSLWYLNTAATPAPPPILRLIEDIDITYYVYIP